MENSQRLNNSYAFEAEDMYDNDNIQSFRPEDDDNREKKGSKHSSAISEKMKINLKGKPKNSSPRTIEELLNEIKSSDVHAYCKDHSDEQLQFYSFTNDKPLCSECLLSGNYTGCEVLSLKKAVSRIKPKVEGLLEDVGNKVDQLEILEEKFESKNLGVDEFVAESKATITDQVNRLRSAITRKEKELLDSLDTIKNQKQKELESRYTAVVKTKKDMAQIREVLEGKAQDLKDIELCQYYSSKGDLIRNFIEDENTIAMKDLRQALQSNSLRDQVNFDEIQTTFDAALRQINKLVGLDLKTTTNTNISKLESTQNRKIRFSERDQDQDQAKVLENSSITLSKKNSVVFEDGGNSSQGYQQASSPFKNLKRDLEAISPMPVAVKESSSPTTATEETLRRLFERMEGVRRATPPKEPIVSTRFDVRSVSIPQLCSDNSVREKDPSIKLWNNYKDYEEQSRKKSQQSNTTSTKKLLEPEKIKLTPKSFIPEFESHKRSTTAERYSAARRDAFNPSIPFNGTGANNLKIMVQEESNRQLSSHWRSSSKQGRTRMEDMRSGSFTSKSFGGNSLSLNLQKLKREMGLHDLDGNN